MNWLRKLLVTFALVVVVTTANWFLNRTFHLDSPMLAFFLAITLSARAGGFLQGLIASVMSLGSILLFFSNSYLLAHSAGPLRISIFLFDAFLISIVCGQLRASKIRLARTEAKAREDLNKQVAGATREANAALLDLRAARTFNDSILENLPNMVFVKDAKDLNFVRINRAGEQLLGRSRSELIGKSDRDFFPDDQAESFISADRQALSRSFVIEVFDEAIQTQSGETRYLHTKKIPILGAHGEPEFLLGISEDITERKLRETQKLELFQAQIAKSEAERLSGQMQRLAEAANEANRAKSSFLANISHEIRTPLAAMLGFAELAADETVMNNEHSEKLKTIVRNGRQLLSIVNEVLDLAKVEASHVEIECIEFDLCELINETLNLLRMKASEKSLSLKADLGRLEGVWVKSDPTRLRQILINVVGNAIKFTEAGSVTVEASVVENSAHRSLLCIQVIDSGIGLSSDQSARIFKPFTQADESMTRRFGGTGLGLVLSKRLAQLLGVDVTLIKSETGVGSQFQISIATEKVIPKLETPESLRANENASVPEELHVLIVDDAPDNRQLLKAYLARLGVSAEQATNGLEGVQKAQQGDFDLILMDVQMPEMDGIAAVKALRRLRYTKPIIALTAHAMKGDRERCLDAGFNDYLQKPIDRVALELSLRKFGPSRQVSGHKHDPLSELTGRALGVQS